MSDAHIRLEHISKSFGRLLANDDISIDINRGEILALLGENGSGKSTLVNILSGIYIPDAGKIMIDGEERNFSSPREAIAAGIGMVHQHFMLIPVMSALENIILGGTKFSGLSGSLLINKKITAKKLIEIEQRFGLHADLHKKIYDMSVSEKQSVEILRILYRGAVTFILDEPTAVLTPQEVSRLFVILRTMKANNCAIIIITHKLNEVMEISDRVTVLRKGKCVGTVLTTDTSERALTEMMVGKNISLEIKREAAARSSEPVLRIKNLVVKNKDHHKAINNMSFDIHGGEILGVAGIAGSGQRELCEAISGLKHAASGSILFLGAEITGLSPYNIRKRGVAMSFVPEDRLGMGLAGGMSVADNVLLRSYNATPGITLDRSNSRQASEEIVKKYAVATPSIHHIVRKLSGGNIQKVLLGREIEQNPKLLITAYPVRGLDVGASFSVYDMLNEQKKNGVAILYIGEDLDVIMQLCDRIMVIHDGEIMTILDAAQATKENIGLLMLGHRL